MQDDIFIYVGENGSSQLIDYCQANNISRLMLVVDDNTYAAAGQQLEESLRTKGFDLKISHLKGQEIVATERYFVQVMLDIGRFASDAGIDEREIRAEQGGDVLR